jgi:preprotein translocase subunit SecG
MSILINILTVILIFVSLFLILVVLAQKAKTDGGVGGALGGGMTEATFGADTGNVLSKATINAAIAFFVLSFVLYLGHIYVRKHAAQTGDALPSIVAPVHPVTLPAPVPATPKKP